MPIPTGFKYKGNDLDGELIENLTKDLVNGAHTRLPSSLYRKTCACISAAMPKTNAPSNRGRGGAWIDAEELQPARIITQLAFRIQWAIRFFLGTDLRQTEFSITYVRVAENIWFPSTYGTEFRLHVLFGYKRMIALSLESSDFRKTDVNSKIEFENAITR